MGSQIYGIVFWQFHLAKRKYACAVVHTFSSPVESTIHGRIVGVGRRITPFFPSKASSNYNFKLPDRCPGVEQPSKSKL